jgi:hypothetical protein
LAVPQEIKGTWCVGGKASGQLVRVTMLESRPRPCNSQCPWLVANHGKTAELAYDHRVPGVAMPEGGYAFAPWKRARIWETDLRDGLVGYGSICHVRLQGTGQVLGNIGEVVACQCTGALVVQQRELLRHCERGESALSPRGAARVASDMLGREVTEHELGDLEIRDLLEHAHPSLLDPKIGSDAVAPLLSEREMDQWKRPSGPAARHQSA